MNRNEKGQISPAQSKIARSYRKVGVSPKAPISPFSGEYAKRNYATPSEDYMTRGERKTQRSKLKVIARGQKDAYRRSWLKGYSAVRKGKG